MGDIADMMLDGTLCQHCGSFLGDGDGIPASCGCEDDDDVSVDYKSLKQERQARHAEWKVANMKVIDKSGIPYKKTGNEALIFREAGKPKADFYPSTGRWRDVDQSRTYSGGAKKFLRWYATIQAIDSLKEKMIQQEVEELSQEYDSTWGESEGK